MFFLGVVSPINNHEDLKGSEEEVIARNGLSVKTPFFGFSAQRTYPPGLLII